MIQQKRTSALATVFCGVFLLAGLGGAVRIAAADEPAPDKPEPPALLQKKAKSDVGEVEKPSPAKEKKPDAPAVQEEKPRVEKPAVSSDQKVDEQEVLNRLSKNMRLAAERLASKELTEGTRQIQRDILKDLDALIEQQSRQSQDSSNARSSAGGAGSGNQQRQQASRQQQGASRGQARSSQSGGQGTKSVPGGKPQVGMPRDLPKRGGDDGARTQVEQIRRFTDLFTFKEKWGQLPETQRAAMDAYAREAFMDKYRELIERYYATIAEKSRRQGGD